MSRKNQGGSEEGHGIRLPGSLLEELKSRQSPEDDDTSRFDLAKNFESKKRNLQSSRKEKRKQERSAKKQRKSKAHQQREEDKSDSKNNKNSKSLKGKSKGKPQSNSEEESDSAEEADDFQGFSADEEVNEEDIYDSDDYEDFQDDELEDNDFEDEYLDEDDSEDQPQTAEDTMKALMALKAKKQHKKEVQPTTAEKTMELLKAKKQEKLNSKEPTAQETLELLRKQKEAKKPKKSDKVLEKKKKVPSYERYISPEDSALLKRDTDDINYYAKKLGLKSTKLSDLKDDEDGLGGLLDGLDFLDNYGEETDYDQYDESETESFEDNGEDEHKLNEVDTEGEEEEEELDDNDENQDDEDEEIVQNPFSSDDELNSSDFDSDLEGELEDEEDVLRPAPKENPYVAPVTASKKYIPPALRAKLEGSGNSEQNIKIKRLIKGPLNKLSEANIITIVNEINSVYLDNPRQVVTECLTEVLLEGIVQQSVLLDTFVILHAALITSIYRLQGVEAGAYFIQALVEKYEEYHQQGNSKASGNLISFLTACYSFQMISCKLLYNLITTLIEDISEIDSELLLRIVKNAGQQLRVDDPNSLKDIILTLQKNLIGKETNARTKFLVETITNLKNNKSKINNEAAHTLIIRMKKVLGTINNNKFHEPLQVTLEDIHNVKTKGKWWLVGAAWKGNLANSSKEESNVNEEELNEILDDAEPNWMELARQQRMNTDIRRAIFITIMSSNDYIEAFTKLDKLRLKRSQEREIPKILLHCVSIEKMYNPYYSLLANKLCSTHSLRKAFQFSFWDLLGEVEDADGDNSDNENGDDYFKNLSRNLIQEDSDFQLKRFVNLGKFFGSLMAEGSLPLNSLKNTNFVSLTADNSLLLEVLLISFFDNIGKKSEVAVFGNSSKKSKAGDLRFQDTLLIETLAKSKSNRSMLRGLQYFLQEKVRESDLISGRKQTKRVQWGVDSTCDIVDEFLKSER